MKNKQIRTYLKEMEDKEWDRYFSEEEFKKRELIKKKTLEEKKYKNFIKEEKLRYISNN